MRCATSTWGLLMEAERLPFAHTESGTRSVFFPSRDQTVQRTFVRLAQTPWPSWWELGLRAEWLSWCWGGLVERLELYCLRTVVNPRPVWPFLPGWRSTYPCRDPYENWFWCGQMEGKAGRWVGKWANRPMPSFAAWLCKMHDPGYHRQCTITN